MQCAPGRYEGAYLNVSLPSLGAIEPPVKMPSSPPKSTAPMGVKPCFLTPSDVSYWKPDGERGSAAAEDPDDMNQVRLKNMTRPITIIKDKCCRRAILVLDRGAVSRREPSSQDLATVSVERMRCKVVGQ